ncbi:MAG: chemotaxis protein CheW [Treponema sp.]|nr:chemotaxis protein CheW [Treponema sp.]MEE3312991.1 chemotaxis protein CheW [Treponema sp.]
MSDELLEEILEEQEMLEAVNIDENAASWLVFKAGKDFYAINSSDVREILRNNEIFPMPFVPPYIRGILNSYGIPYAVLDLSLFINNERQDSKLFMILKDSNNLSIQVTDIQEFHSSSDVTIQTLSNQNDTPFFSGAISFDGVTAPILDIPGILEKIRTDLESE